MSERETRSSAQCPICDGATLHELYKPHVCVSQSQFLRYASGEGTDGEPMEPFRHCDTCGFVFRPGRLRSRILDRYVEAQADDQETRAGIQAHYDDRLNSGKAQRIGWIEGLCRFKDVLDVGTGNGELVKILVDRGYHATGIDPNERRIRIANEVFGLSLKSGFYSVDSYQAGQFDLVTAECVVYRFDPIGVFFDAAWKHLRPGGALFMVLPDIHRVPLNFIPNGVRCLFAPGNMSSLLARWGFELVSTTERLEAEGALQDGTFAVLAKKIARPVGPRRYLRIPDCRSARHALLARDYGLTFHASPLFVAALALLDGRVPARVAKSYVKKVNRLVDWAKDRGKKGSAPVDRSPHR